MDRILLVEDDKGIGESIYRTLQADYAVEVAENGQQALEKAGDRFYDLILLDYKLPDIDGIEVAERLKEKSPDISIIFITAYGSMDIVIQALRLGVFDFIEKPFHAEVLRAAINRCCSFRRLQVEKARLEIRKTALSMGIPSALNELLTTVTGDLLILEDALGPVIGAKDLFTKIWNDMLRVLNILKRIEDFCGFSPWSRRVSTVDLNEIVNEVVSFVGTGWEEAMKLKGYPYQIVKELGELKPAHAEPQELRDILMNLIVSATNSMPKGGVLTITTAMEGGEAVVNVKDTGPGGVDMARIRLLEPLYMAKTNPSYDGTGLGLFLVKYIVNNHGGRVGVEHEPSKGTTFTIKLPLCS